MFTGLIEDLGRAGDLTTDSIIGPDATATVQLVARDRGVLAGLPLAQLAWELVDPRIECDVHLPDGSRLQPGSARRAVAARMIVTPPIAIAVPPRMSATSARVCVFDRAASMSAFFR